jgi:hypothetical protein
MVFELMKLTLTKAGAKVMGFGSRNATLWHGIERKTDH